MILVDTSVWIDHIVSELPTLRSALDRAAVLVHPFVIGELACGHLRNRDIVLREMRELPGIETIHHEEALTFIERHALMGKGLSLVDVHLLASTTIAAGAKLWSRDKRLHAAASNLRVSFLEYDA